MITKLTLTNFKKHERLVLDFATGLTALKGANEAGKSTIYHAVVYALFGARALPMTLAETVTYDKPESSLKVELSFTFEGTTYTIIRSKSGAIISSALVTANGQAEVTKFVEKLFGVNADAATKLMVASQGALRGALETGEAVPLIEKLANIDLIDKKIAAIQDQLPSGNTKQLVDAIEIASQAVAPVLNTEDLEPAVEFTKNALALAEQELLLLQINDTINGTEQQAIVAAVTAAEQRYDQITKELMTITDRLAIPPEKPVVDIEAAKQGLEHSREHSARLKAYRQFIDRPTYQPAMANYQEAVDLNEKIAEGVTAAILQHKLTIASCKSLLITESACGLCGKDLTEVPEVVTKNAANEGKIREAEGYIASLTEQLEGCQAARKDLAKIGQIDAQINNLYLVIEKFTEISRDKVPATLTWKGDIPEQIDVWPDYVSEIREGERLLREHDRAVAVYNELTAQQNRLLSESKNLVVDRTAKTQAQELLAAKAVATEAITAKRAEISAAAIAANDARHELSRAISVYELELANYNKAMETKASLEESLAITTRNNALIKKLRDVRPIVASRLWSIVLASVSTYFSQIRNTPSVVTRSSTSFAVGGKPVGGLSGSTLDALGLAIRMALSKTFLPSIDYMLLDEPAAGMDDERETAMLGLLAATGYTQVVVVTHSGLADAFATSVIQL